MTPKAFPHSLTMKGTNMTLETIPAPKKPSNDFWRISNADAETLRAVASAAARRQGARGRITMEPGVRKSTSRPDLVPDMNVRLVDGSDDWEDSDLWSHTQFKTFREGVRLDEEGLAVVDLYCYGLDGLACNVQAWADLSGLVAVTTDGPEGDLILWQAPREVQKTAAATPAPAPEGFDAPAPVLTAAPPEPFGRVVYEVRDVEGGLIAKTPDLWQAESRARNRKERTGLDADVFKVERVKSTRGEFVIVRPRGN